MSTTIANSLPTSFTFPFPSSLSFLIPRSNVSYYAVPIAWFLSFAPHVYAVKRYDSLRQSTSPTSSVAVEGGKLKFNKTSPRTFLSTLQSNPHLSQDEKDGLYRAEAAHLNGMENLGWFAAGVVAANCAGVDGWWCNALSLWYLVSRLGFNVLYVMGVKGEVRAAAFYAGTGATIALFIKAGNAAGRMTG